MWAGQMSYLPEAPQMIQYRAAVLASGCFPSELGSDHSTGMSKSREPVALAAKPPSTKHPAGGMSLWEWCTPQELQRSWTSAVKDREVSSTLYLPTDFSIRTTKHQGNSG